MANKNSFVLYTNWAKAWVKLPADIYTDLTKGVLNYILGNDYEFTTEVGSAMFEQYKEKLDEDASEWERKKNARSEGSVKGWKKRNKSKLEKDDAQCNPMETNGNEWNPMESNGNECVPMETNGNEGVTVTVTDTVTDKHKKESVEKKPTPTAASGKGKYVDDPDLNDAICKFIVHRKTLHKPMSLYAVNLFISKLEKLAPGNTQGKIALIDEAIEHGWQTVYTHDDGKFKSRGRPPKTTGFNNNFHQRTYDMDALEQQLLSAQ